MISVTHGYERYKDGVRYFVGLEKIPCPTCSGHLKVHGSCRRKLRCEDGVRTYQLRVMECCSCGRTHRELPAGVIPYKRLDAEHIARIGSASRGDHLKFCETSTWIRISAWVSWFLRYAQKILEGILSERNALTVPVGIGFTEQLMYFVRLVVNSGFWIQHRSVQITE